MQEEFEDKKKGSESKYRRRTDNTMAKTKVQKDKQRSTKRNYNEKVDNCSVVNEWIMKRKCNKFHQYQQNKQITSHLNSLRTKNNTTTCDVGNPGRGKRHAQKYGCVKSVNEIQILSSL